MISQARDSVNYSLPDSNGTAKRNTRKPYRKFPFPVVKAFGCDSKTMAALWNVPDIRRTGKVFRPLKWVAYHCGIPLTTFKRQKSKLESLGVVVNKGRKYKGSVSLAVDLVKFKEWYESENCYWLEIDKETLLERKPFCETILLAYYKFRCGASVSEKHWCIDTFPQIMESIGFSDSTLRATSTKLAKEGLIVREELPKGNYAVSIKGRMPDYKPLERSSDDVTLRPDAKLAQRFCGLYEATFGKVYPGGSKKMLPKMQTIIDNCGGDFSEAEKYVVFSIEKWKRLKEKALQWSDANRPTPGFLASPDIIERIQGCIADGIPRPKNEFSGFAQRGHEAKD